jgi:hypothetical protein
MLTALTKRLYSNDESAGRRWSADLGNSGNDSVDRSKETAVTHRQMREKRWGNLRHPFYATGRWKCHSLTLPPQLLTHFRLSHLTTEATLLWICQQIPKICTLRVDVASEDVIVSKTQPLRTRKHLEAFCNIADAVSERLELVYMHQSVSGSFPRCD